MKGQEQLIETLSLNVILVAALVALLIVLVLFYLSGQGLNVELPRLI